MRGSQICRCELIVCRNEPSPAHFRLPPPRSSGQLRGLGCLALLTVAISQSTDQSSGRCSTRDRLSIERALSRFAHCTPPFRFVVSRLRPPTHYRLFPVPYGPLARELLCETLFGDSRRVRHCFLRRRIVPHSSRTLHSLFSGNEEKVPGYY